MIINYTVVVKYVLRYKFYCVKYEVFSNKFDFIVRWSRFINKCSL